MEEKEGGEKGKGKPMKDPGNDKGREKGRQADKESMAAIESVPIIDWAVALHHPQVRSFGRVYTLSTLQI